jgi:hypothetical protein
MKAVGSFVKAVSAPPKKRRLIMLLHGAPKAGKTHFALSAPAPVLLFDFDKGTEGVIENFDKKEVYRAAYDFARPTMKKERGGAEYLDKIRMNCTPVWEKFVEDWTLALKSDARTLVIDTATAAFTLGKLSYIGWSQKVERNEDKFGQMSGALGAAFGGLITQAYDADKHLILLARERAVWEDGKPVPGEFESLGWPQLPYEVQVVARISKAAQADGKLLRRITIVESRLQSEFATGLVFKEGEAKSTAGPMTFTSIASTITGTEEAAWA